MTLKQVACRCLEDGKMLTKLNAAVSLVIRIGIRRSRMGMAVVVLIIGGNDKEDNAIDIERSGYDQDGNDSRTD